MQQALLELLQYGFNPYDDNTALEESMFSEETTTSNKISTIKQQASLTREQQCIGSSSIVVFRQKLLLI